MKEVLMFQCDFCEKTYKNKSSAKRHEKECFANPITKSCRTCKWLNGWKWCDEMEYGHYECLEDVKFNLKDNGRIVLNNNCNKWELLK